MGEYVLECLQPPQSLKRLSIKGYPGVCIPRWMRIRVASLNRAHEAHVSDACGRGAWAVAYEPHCY
ncbi:hypothetical protein CCACVL1_30200 [Corchorus capsularis]|uniref:R13L1/DRL21-like LRR repeat region domain-containing protein n=1 Tax=Corchorus capsularis TaxID=210143 RepID=A0A1R3FYD7_COCAP|nr:hypothetical protein CCACVL1_30200 [Corchorus capsularis]